MLLLVCGCATHKHAGRAPESNQADWRAVIIEPGAVAVVAADRPANVAIDVALGRTAYGDEAAGATARTVLEAPDFHDPGLDMAAGPVCFVLAPFTAAYSALSAGRSRISGDNFAQAERDVASAMREMARQSHLRDCVRETVEGAGRGVVPDPSSAGTMAVPRESAGAVLETAVEELRLERVGASEASFALTIRARVRLLRGVNGAVLLEQPMRYQSGTALFLDWTYPQVLERVARTGYGELAQQIATNLRAVTAQGPVLVGAGFKRPAPRSAVIPVSYAARVRPGRALHSPQPTLRHVVSYPLADPERFSVFSAQTTLPVSLQLPLTKDDAVIQARQDVEWGLDGLHHSRNSVVQLSAIAVAIPWSVCQQMIAGVRGVSAKQLKRAEAELSAAARTPELQKKLAGEVAQQLAPRLSPPTVLVSQSAGTASELEETALGISVLRAALTGEGEVNPALALCVEARATVFRPSDGVELYSWPIHYRSDKRKFTQWAADDARLFREELKRCQQQVAVAIVDQVSARQLIGPDRTRQPILANN